MGKALKYGAVLIGLYIAAAYATGFGQSLTAGGNAGSGIIKAFQGR
jgi:hypothetical protein